MQESYRLPPPPNCPDAVYKLMVQCWRDDRAERPKFGKIVEIIDAMLAAPNTDEMRRPSRVREALPVNPRAPTLAQLVSTRQFLAALALDHYNAEFDRLGYSNMSKLFHLDANDLALIGMCLTLPPSLKSI